MILIPKAEGQFPTKGEWSLRLVGGKQTAQLACPKCGESQSLADHEIADDGTVTPSVACNVCGYHESGLKLEGWHPRGAWPSSSSPRA